VLRALQIVIRSLSISYLAVRKPMSTSLIVLAEHEFDCILQDYPLHRQKEGSFGLAAGLSPINEPSAGGGDKRSKDDREI